MLRIALIGAGGIGRRHLQAIAKLPIEFEVFIYDKNHDSLDYIEIFCSENNISTSKINFIKSEDVFYNCISTETIVIVATTADDRKEILDKCIENIPLTIIAEKPLVQNNVHYEQIKNKAEKFGVKIYINFLAHLQPFWREIYEDINDLPKITMCTSLPKNWGIACVGIHHFNLFTWLTNDKEIELIDSNVKYVFEQKRAGFFDISGRLLFSTKNGSALYIDSSENAGISSIQIITDQKIYNYLELHQQIVAVESGGSITVSPAKEKYISNYMTDVIKDIVMRKTCLLPDICQSHLSHKMLFEYMSTNGLNDLNIT